MPRWTGRGRTIPGAGGWRHGCKTRRMAGGRVSEEHFTVSYDGPALADHEMDVADLARSLLALSTAFKQAQHTLDGAQPPVSLHAKAVAPGSFEVAMVLVQPGIVDGILDFLANRPATAVANASALAHVVWNTFGIIRWLAGRRIVSARPSAEPGKLTIETDDGDTLQVTAPDLALVRNVDFRKSVSQVVEPLDREGINSFVVRRETHIEVRIGEQDRRSFDPPQLPSEEDLDTSTRRTVLQPVGVEFDWRKWRFTEGGGASFTATIADEEFRTKIERQEVTVGANDLLRVSLRTRQYRDRTGSLRAEHIIERVIEHIDGGRQLPLDFTSE